MSHNKHLRSDFGYYITRLQYKIKKNGPRVAKYGELLRVYRKLQENPDDEDLLAKRKELHSELSVPQQKLPTVAVKSNTTDGFGNIVCLGEYGGIVTGNLSCYLLQIGSEDKKPQYICFDGGSLVDGLKVYNATRSQEDVILLSQIKAYLISHAHLDHVIGLVMVTPAINNLCTDFTKKPPQKIVDNQPYLIATPHVHSAFKSIFNNAIWPDVLYECFRPINLVATDEANDPFETKLTLDGDISLPNITITARCVTHRDMWGSTMFTVTSEPDQRAVVYFGDVTVTKHLQDEPNENATKQVETILAECNDIGENLLAVFIECAFPKHKEGMALYGHIDTEILKTQLSKLKTSPTVFVTHRKPEVYDKPAENGKVMGTNDLKRIEDEIREDASKNFIFPKQGEPYIYSWEGKQYSSMRPRSITVT